MDQTKPAKPLPQLTVEKHRHTNAIFRPRPTVNAVSAAFCGPYHPVIAITTAWRDDGKCYGEFPRVIG